jgi:hypothetical protein
MRYSPRKTSSVWPTILIVTAVTVFPVIGIAGSIGTLWAMGKIDLPFLSREPTYEGMVGIPMSGQPIPRYTKITRDNVFNPKTGTWAVKYVRPEQVTPNVLTETSQIFGRVLKHDKPAGYVFTEDDFYPKGTAPGETAGVPPGKRGLTLDPDKLRGIRSLQAGDRIDILGAVPMDEHKHPTGLGILVPSPVVTDSVKHASVKVLVQNGLVVAGVSTRMVPTTASGLTTSGQTKMKPVQEVVIAADPEEVGRLLEALALNADLLCVARSGRPDDPGAASVTPDLAPPVQTSVVRTWIGGKRETEVFVTKPPAK